MKKTISLYLTKEIIWPFFIGLLIFTFIFLMNSVLQLTEMVVNKGVKLVDISKLTLYAMPSFLLFTLPMALLMAILVALGRLSGDNEITAMKVSGIGIHQLVAPIMIFSLICSLLTSFVAIYALPWGNSSSNRLIFDIAKNKVNIGIKERTFNSDFKDLILYVNEIAVRGEILKGILVYEKEGTGEPNTIIAKEGYLVSDPNSLVVTLRLIDGKIHSASEDFNSYQEIGFSTYDINLNLGTIVKEQGVYNKEYSEMSIGELQRKIEELKDDKKNLYHPLHALYEKFSIPFACLIFGLIAIPLGIQSQPSSKFWGFVLSLGVILAYYILLTFGDILAKNGEISLIVALWGPNFLIGILGIYMLYKTVNDLPIKFIVWTELILQKVGLKH